jgi:hypothetical protein
MNQHRLSLPGAGSIHGGEQVLRALLRQPGVGSAYYGVIPETVLGVTSISSRKTKQYESAWGVFSYRSVKPQTMMGYQVIESTPGIKFKIAYLKKALLDYLYLQSEVQSLADFEGLRWTRTQLLGLLDHSIFARYLKLFDKRTLENRGTQFLEYLNA